MLEEWSKKKTDEIFTWFNLDTDPIFSPRFKRFIKWLGYKFNPFVLQVAGFIILLWIFNKIYVGAGMDKLMIVFMVIVIFSLRGMASSLKKLVE